MEKNRLLAEIGLAVDKARYNERMAVAMLVQGLWRLDPQALESMRFRIDDALIALDLQPFEYAGAHIPFCERFHAPASADQKINEGQVCYIKVPGIRVRGRESSDFVVLKAKVSLDEAV